MAFSKFREHRGGLDESMGTVVRLCTYNGLLTHVRSLLAPYCVPVHSLEIRPYCYDDRIKWDTYIVTLDGYGVVGFTDGAVDDIPK